MRQDAPATFYSSDWYAGTVSLCAESGVGGAILVIDWMTSIADSTFLSSGF